MKARTMVIAVLLALPLALLTLARSHDPASFRAQRRGCVAPQEAHDPQAAPTFWSG